ncbi:hypothetical protein B0H10DRAFT_1958896 [Mycena sp. CBHHK59/15]|nr:hypothetical protein B0H10DRAFT_1958896 [Mycena sp. CBHHK59/15]
MPVTRSNSSPRTRSATAGQNSPVSASTSSPRRSRSNVARLEAKHARLYPLTVSLGIRGVKAEKRRIVQRRLRAQLEVTITHSVHDHASEAVTKIVGGELGLRWWTRAIDLECFPHHALDCMALGLYIPLYAQMNSDRIELGMFFSRQAEHERGEREERGRHVGDVEVDEEDPTADVKEEEYCEVLDRV